MPTRVVREPRDAMTADGRRAARLAQAERRVESELAVYQRGLAELRRARAHTQTQLARNLNVSQAQVSRIEHQTDLYLSTLQSYLEALGGRLELVAVFDDERVVLSLADLTEADTEAEPEPATTP